MCAESEDARRLPARRTNKAGLSVPWPSRRDLKPTDQRGVQTTDGRPHAPPSNNERSDDQ